MKPYPKRPTSCEIDLSALRSNYKQVKEETAKGCRILAVVKADAYGHGAVQVSKELESMGVDYLGVAILEEALELREAGIKSPMMILSGLFEGQEGAAFDYDLTPVVYTLESAERFNLEAIKRKKCCSIHIKVDTGMGRLGVRADKAVSLLTKVAKMEWIDIEGLATHFSSADEPQKNSTIKQIRLFTSIVEEAEKLGLDIPLKHAANSAGTFHFPQGHFNMVRPGISLYGVSPSCSMKNKGGLKPVMSLKTKVMEIKKLERGETVSYGETYTAKQESTIAVIPVGYADGYRRELSNTAEVVIRGKRAKVAGRICMDMTMIDVTGIDGVKKGDDVYLMGGSYDNAVTACEIADIAGTIAYEVLCGVSQRVPRYYINAQV
ncbi:MAG: alanine racemase [Proteobacteria bacterium]|nr:alanine racemase [Pseudomonadota bacterium]